MDNEQNEPKAKVKSEAVQSESKRNYALLAIVLPFVGLIAGATLEHGAGFLCTLGLAECKVSQSEVSHLRETIKNLQEDNRVTVQDLQSNTTSALQLAAMCHNTLREASFGLKSIKIEPDRNFANAIAMMPEAQRRLNSITSSIDRSAAQILERGQELQSTLDSQRD